MIPYGSAYSPREKTHHLIARLRPIIKASAMQTSELGSAQPIRSPSPCPSPTPLNSAVRSTERSSNGYDDSPRCRRGQHRYDGCQPLASPTDDERPQMSCALTPAEVARSGIQTAFFTRLGPLESVPGGKSTIGAWSSSRGRYSGARTGRRCCRANVIWEMSVTAT